MNNINELIQALQNSREEVISDEYKVREWVFKNPKEAIDLGLLSIDLSSKAVRIASRKCYK